MERREGRKSARESKEMPERKRLREVSLERLSLEAEIQSQAGAAAYVLMGTTVGELTLEAKEERVPAKARPRLRVRVEREQEVGEVMAAARLEIEPFPYPGG